jgi:hypothetical protein
MKQLVDKIERAMYSVNPFGYREYGNYYYEANNLIKLLPYFKVGDSVLDLCMDSFQIYNDGSNTWVQIAEKLEHIVRQYLSSVRSNLIKEELMMNVFHPHRVERWTEQGFDDF